MKLHQSLLAATLLIVFISSCKKDEDPPTPQEKQEFAMTASQSDAEAELIFDDVFDNVMGVSDEVGIGGTGIFDTTSCFTVTTTQLGSTRFPLKVLIDFGSGCLCRDGRTRKGKIIFTYTGRLMVPGNSVAISFDGYTVSEIQVAGSCKITNTGTTGARSFTIEVNQAKLTKPNHNFSEWNSTKTITQVEGNLTPAIAIDDVFSITGRANGSVVRNNKLFIWSTQITDPLIKRFNCFRIVKGAIELRRGNAAAAVLDYGTGVCDNKATLTVNGTGYEITLH